MDFIRSEPVIGESDGKKCVLDLEDQILFYARFNVEITTRKYIDIGTLGSIVDTYIDSGTVEKLALDITKTPKLVFSCLGTTGGLRCHSYDSNGNLTLRGSISGSGVAHRRFVLDTSRNFLFVINTFAGGDDILVYSYTDAGVLSGPISSVVDFPGGGDDLSINTINKILTVTSTGSEPLQNFPYDNSGNMGASIDIAGGDWPNDYLPYVSRSVIDHTGSNDLIFSSGIYGVPDTPGVVIYTIDPGGNFSPTWVGSIDLTAYVEYPPGFYPTDMFVDTINKRLYITQGDEKSALIVLGYNPTTYAMEVLYQDINGIYNYYNGIGGDIAKGLLYCATDDEALLLYKEEIVNVYLVKNDTDGSSIANSMALINKSSLATFFTTNKAVSNDEINNLMSYNYGSDDFDLGNPPTHIADSMPNTDPLLIGISDLDWDSKSVSEIMDDMFLPDDISMAVDNGNNSFVTDVDTDIIGNQRIYISGVVDIGPYELQVHQLDFTADKIQSIFQDKLHFDLENSRFVPVAGDDIYTDLWSQFTDNPAYREEFIRESKVIIKLKTLASEIKFSTDKKNVELARFEAYFDLKTKSIIFSKTGENFGAMLNSIFDDGRYVFYFDEIEHILIVYINPTYNMGKSGKGNIVNEVRAGGSAIINR